MTYEQIEKLLTTAYHTTADDDGGCYLNGKWFSISAILELLKKES